MSNSWLNPKMGPKWDGVEVVFSGGGRRLKLLVRASRRIGDGLESDGVYGVMYLCVWLLSVIFDDI